VSLLAVNLPSSSTLRLMVALDYPSDMYLWGFAYELWPSLLDIVRRRSAIFLGRSPEVQMAVGVLRLFGFAEAESLLVRGTSHGLVSPQHDTERSFEAQRT
jgi:hypothetical protein